MIAPLRQPPSIELAAPSLSPLAGDATGDAAGDRLLALLTSVWAFFCFMPYPAISVGNATALQIGNLITLLLTAPICALCWKKRPFWIYPLIIVPLCVAAVKVAVTGTGSDISLCLKVITVWGVSCMALVTVQLYARGYGLQMLSGIACATLVHAAVGAWQAYSFQSGVFPMVGLYVNPSFLSVQENAEIIARYTQRPFGIFPEPSAMSSSLAPWVVVWGAYFCGIVRFRSEPTPGQRILFAAAVVGGMGLIILSQSGHAAITLSALLVFAVVWFFRSRATVRTYAVLVVALGVVLPLVLWAAMLSLSTRVGGGEMGNSSWQERSSSLVIGFNLLVSSDIPRAIFGMGPGLSAPALWEVAQIDAVFSVLLTYVYETGLVGAFAVAWLGVYLVRVWRAAGFDVTYVAFGGVWLVGITLTTSYSQLLPLWIALGWLTVWPEVCGRAQISQTAKPGQAVIRKTPVPRTTKWVWSKTVASDAALSDTTKTHRRWL
jgi:hypothetical protein